jgi:hypothetical protein
MEQVDLGPVVDALPFSPAVKATIVCLLPLIYSALLVARRFTPPASQAGKVIRAVLVGWKHPDERPLLLEKRVEEPPKVIPIVPLLLVGMLGLSGCAALSGATGSTGPVDMGKGVICSITASPTDTIACTKALAQSCEVPLPVNGDGECSLDAIAASVPFEPGKGATCVVSAAAGSRPCTKLIATSCTVPVPRAADGVCR